MNLASERFLARWSELHAAGMLFVTVGLASQILPLPLAALLGGASFWVLLWGQRGFWTPSGHFGLANWVTLLRLIGVLGLLANSATGKSAVAVAVFLWFLDGIDGWLATRLNLASPFGELFDKETDAFFTLALTALLYCAADVPAWILIAGSLRYGFVLMLKLAGFEALELPPVPLARPIGALALFGLILGLWPPPAFYLWVLAALTWALGISFALSFWRPSSALMPKPVPIRSQAEIRAFFDALACDYRDLHGHPKRLASYRLKIIDSLLRGTYRGTLLEIGCGTGIHLFALAPKFERAIGIDLSPKMIERAASQNLALGLSDRVELFPSSAETLAGVQDSSIDVALMVGVLEHVPNKPAVFEALKRVLKPQGCAICLTPNAGFCYYRWRVFKHKPWKILSSDEFLDAAQAAKLVQEAGLELACLNYWRFVPKGGMPKLWGLGLTLLDWPGKWLGLSSLRGGLYFKAAKPQSPADGR